MVDPFGQGRVREQTQIRRTWGRGGRKGGKFRPSLVQVYLLITEDQRLAGFARWGGECRPRHAQPNTVETAGFFDVFDRQDQMVERADRRLHLNGPSQCRREARRG